LAGELAVDAAVATHDHLDHFDPETILPVVQSNPDCVVLGPASVMRHCQRLGIATERCRLLSLGTGCSVDGFRLAAVPAFHSDPDAIGVLLEADGQAVYLTGDSQFSDVLPHEVARAVNCLDMILICINGRMENMNTEDALAIVERLRPRIAIPIHYGMFSENTADPKLFLEGCRRLGIRACELQPGVPLSFRLLNDSQRREA
jgi:L-ascorbate metabolism protein UlaG (beta-lactamase superfamily)